MRNKPGRPTRPSPLRLAWITLAALVALQAWTSSAANDDRLVRVRVSNHRHDPFHPWQTSKPGRRMGYGVQIDPQHILTTERLVRNQTLVEIQRPRSADKMQVEVLMSDHRLDLALLKMPLLPMLKQQDAIAIEENIRLGDSLEILQMDDVRDLQAGPVRVQQIRVGQLPDSPNSLL